MYCLGVIQIHVHVVCIFLLQRFSPVVCIDLTPQTSIITSSVSSSGGASAPVQSTSSQGTPRESGGGRRQRRRSKRRQRPKHKKAARNNSGTPLKLHVVHVKCYSCGQCIWCFNENFYWHSSYNFIISFCVYHNIMYFYFGSFFIRPESTKYIQWFCSCVQ